MNARVDYLRTGGLAGIDMAVVADEADLLPEYLQLVRRLLEAPRQPGSDAADAGVAGVEALDAGRIAAPDTFHYRLRVADGDRVATFAWPESQIPDDVRPLLTDLGRRATPVARRP